MRDLFIGPWTSRSASTLRVGFEVELNAWEWSIRKNDSLTLLSGRVAFAFTRRYKRILDGNVSLVNWISFCCGGCCKIHELETPCLQIIQFYLSLPTCSLTFLLPFRLSNPDHLSEYSLFLSTNFTHFSTATFSAFLFIKKKTRVLQLTEVGRFLFYFGRSRSFSGQNILSRLTP